MGAPVIGIVLGTMIDLFLRQQSACVSKPDDAEVLLLHTDGAIVTHPLTPHPSCSLLRPRCISETEVLNRCWSIFDASDGKAQPAGGKGLTEAQAMVSAIGEGIERYCASRDRAENLLVASYNEVKDQALNPRDLILDPQYPVKYSDSLPIEWVEGYSLTRECSVLVPANAVFFPYTPKGGCKSFNPQDTTGLASGQNLDDAILQGLLEAIERDAYVITWRRKLVCPTIMPNTFADWRVQAALEHFERAKVKVHLKNITTDLGVPVIHALGEDMTGEGPIFTHGSGCHLDPAIACLRAITEVAQLRVTQCKLISADPSYYKNPRKMAEPVFSWASGTNRSSIEFLSDRYGTQVKAQSLPNRTTRSIEGDLTFLVDVLKKHNHEVIVVNLSRHDVPVPVVRVIVPGLQPLDDTCRRLSRRLWEYPSPLKLLDRSIFTERIFS